MMRKFLAKNKKEKVSLIFIAIFIAFSLISLIFLYIGGIIAYMMLIAIISMLFYIPISVFLFLFIIFYHMLYMEIRTKEIKDNIWNWILIVNGFTIYCVIYLAYVLILIF